VEDGVVTWRVPLGEGAVPHVSLEDCGYYVRWLFDHPERANGIDLEVAVDQVAYADLAAAFEKVTGHPAQYIDTDLGTYWRNGPLSAVADTPAGYNADPNDKSTMSIRDNFTGFWNLWKYRVVERDFALLDEIHPNRIRSAEEWFGREDRVGRELGKGGLWERVQPENRTPILKVGEDMRTGAL
jgi:NmrA-like family